MKPTRSSNQLFILSALLLLAWPFTGRAQFTFTTSGGAVTITSYTGTNANVVIPSTTNGYPVKNIGNAAFYGKTMVTSLTIPSSVTLIGQNAFYNCSGLTSVTIPSSVTNIGPNAFGNCVFLSVAYFQGNAPKVYTAAGSADNTVFYGNSGSYSQAGVVYYPPGTTGWGSTFGSWPTVCTSNTTPASVFAFTTNNGSISITGYFGTNQDVILPDSINSFPVTTIGDSAFSNSQLRSMVFPNGVTSIGNQAFYNCYYLLSAPLPPNLTSVGNQAFALNGGITEMAIPSGVTNIGSGPFMGAFSLLRISVAAGNPNYASLDGVLFDNAYTTLIQSPCALAGKYVVPNSVITIGSGAFYAYSAGLTNVTIPSSVLSISDTAFSHCPNLKSFSVATNNPNYSSGGGVLFNKALTALIKYPGGLAGSYNISNSVTSIGVNAFAYCSLLNVMIPNSVATIGNYAFDDCAVLTNITVDPANPNYSGLGGVLFDRTLTLLMQYPGGLAGNYLIPNSVTSIAAGAFHHCFRLKSVTFPNSVSSIGYSAFDSCSGLHQVYFQGNAPSVNGAPGSADSSVFSGESGTAFIQPGTTGWGNTFGGWPAVAGVYLPQPQILVSGQDLGMQSDRFKFTISWATNTAVVVEASTNLVNWKPVITNTLVNGTSAFSDSTWTNYPQRFYRVNKP